MDFDYEWEEKAGDGFTYVEMKFTKPSGEVVTMGMDIHEDSAWHGPWLEMFARFCAAYGFVGVGERLIVDE